MPVLFLLPLIIINNILSNLFNSFLDHSVGSVLGNTFTL